MFQIPDPLHPAVVHLPIALSVLIPLLALGAILAIATGFLPARAWLAVVLLQVLLAGSAWYAEETGEHDEDRVERVVAHDPIEEHEEAGKRFVTLSAVTALLVASGLLPGGFGRAGRVIGTLASLGVLWAAVGVGHSGGELVYRHGAGRAYTAPDASPAERAR